MCCLRSKCIPYFDKLAGGADLTFEADSGYNPMDLAVALGHKEGKSTQYVSIGIVYQTSLWASIAGVQTSMDYAVKYSLFFTAQKAIEDHILKLLKQKSNSQKWEDQ